ncbi:MAG: radical SAM protein [Oscillospiraceae bacterium]|nr:radical SAM protein [Oscillospiraceae bacterium]
MNRSLQQLHSELQKEAAREGIPIFGGFELTARCNLSCKMCYVKQKGADAKPCEQELTARQWIDLGQAAAGQGTLTAFLTGGEPLLRADFQEIYDAFCRMGFRLTLFTNGTLITEEFAKWISKIPPSTVDITLYGASDHTYFNLCGMKDGFQKAIDGMERLLQYGVNVRVKTTIVKTNLQDYKAIKSIAESYHLEFLSNTLIHGNREEGIQKCAELRLSPEEMYQINLDTLDEYDRSPIDFQKRKDWIKNLPPMSCTAGRCAFFINWEGKLTPCPLFVAPYTDPLSCGFPEAWRLLREKINEIPAPVKCKTCDKRVFCPVCPPRLYLETGKFNETSEYLCLIAKTKEQTATRYQYGNKFGKGDHDHEKSISKASH